MLNVKRFSFRNTHEYNFHYYYKEKEKWLHNGINFMSHVVTVILFCNEQCRLSINTWRVIGTSRNTWRPPPSVWLSGSVRSWGHERGGAYWGPKAGYCCSLLTFLGWFMASGFKTSQLNTIILHTLKASYLSHRPDTENMKLKFKEEHSFDKTAAGWWKLADKKFFVH